MTPTIQTEVNKTLTILEELFSSFEHEQINVVPFEGSWTAGQLLRHMNMSNSGFVKLINGNVKDTQRKPDEFVERIKSDFLDFSTRFTSPDSVQPPKEIYNKERLLNSLRTIKENLSRSIDTLDLTKTCLDFELPVYGFLTRMEAVNFVLYHTQRHIHQLKKIYQKVANQNYVSLN
jgi:hypothetical protein